jgi:hypothetical protein
VNKKNELIKERDGFKERLCDADQIATDAFQNAEHFFDQAHAAYSMFKTGTMEQKKGLI